MKDNFRMLGTLVIWLALAIIVASTLTSSTGAISRANNGVLFGFVFILTLAATISTLAIWLGPNPTGEALDASHSKAKRRGRERIERLVDSLDDDDIYELETLLLAREDPAQRRDSSR